MGDEITWEPQSVADVGAALSRIGNSYREGMARIYDCINKLGVEGFWLGRNFNIIANDVLNASRANFEEWADYLQTTVPQVVANIADAQAAVGGGSVYFSLTPNSSEIQMVQETPEDEWGSLTLDPTQVRYVVNRTLPEYCLYVYNRLDDYVSQFEELGSIRGNAAMIEMSERVYEICKSGRELVHLFQDKVIEAVELSVNKTIMTDEEARKIAASISSLIN